MRARTTTRSRKAVNWTWTPGNDMLDMADHRRDDGQRAWRQRYHHPRTKPARSCCALAQGTMWPSCPTALPRVYGGTGDDEVVMSDGALLAFLGFGNDTVEGIDGEIEALWPGRQ